MKNIDNALFVTRVFMCISQPVLTNCDYSNTSHGPSSPDEKNMKSVTHLIQNMVLVLEVDRDE